METKVWLHLSQQEVTLKNKVLLLVHILAHGPWVTLHVVVIFSGYHFTFQSITLNFYDQSQTLESNFIFFVAVTCITRRVPPLRQQQPCHEPRNVSHVQLQDPWSRPATHQWQQREHYQWRSWGRRLGCTREWSWFRCKFFGWIDFQEPFKTIARSIYLPGVLENVRLWIGTLFYKRPFYQRHHV